jgi:hypothetical protein
MLLEPETPDTTPNIPAPDRGTMDTLAIIAEGLPTALALSKTSVADPALVVRRAVRRSLSPTSPRSLSAAVHTLSFASKATCGRMYLSLTELPSRTVTALSKVIVVPDILPRSITTSYVFASVTRNTYGVPPIDLKATEKFGVLYASVPREVHVVAFADEAYSIWVPVYQNTQWLPEAAS